MTGFQPSRAVAESQRDSITHSAQGLTRNTGLPLVTAPQITPTPAAGARLCRRPVAATPEHPPVLDFSNHSVKAKLLRLAFSTVALR